MTAEDAMLPTGNRFDLVGVGVLYAATEPEGAFAETLAGFRPSSSLITKMAQHQSDELQPPPGTVDRSWRQARRLRSFHLQRPLPFIDVDHPATHTYLTRHMALELNAMGFQNLDVSVVRGSSRLLTRAIAAWIFAQEDSEYDPLYSGIRYGSRLGNHECWGIFEGAELELDGEAFIDRASPGIIEVEAAFGIDIQ